jgi:imidazolonepropionase-like amidohydrolase
VTPQSWVLRAGTLIDGLSADALRDVAIVIDDNVIAWTGPWDDYQPRPGVEAVDARPFAALPGFIDAHTHMTLFADNRSYEEMASEADAFLLLVGARNARAHLESGVTTARDNGSRGNLAMVLREAINRGLMSGPRLLASGPVVTKPHGHFHFFGIEAEGADDVRAAVDSLAVAGVDHIKIMASGGDTVGTDPRRATYTVEELRAAVDAAHSHGLLTTSHCRALESMQRAAAAGVDCIEHAEFLRPDGNILFDEATADKVAAAGTFVSPTLPAYGWHTLVRAQQARLEGPLNAAWLAAVERAERDTAGMTDNLRRMIGAGLGPRIVGSTDAGCADISFGHMDYCMEMMERAGMGRMQVIQACTSTAASAIGLGDTVGAIAPGRLADIVLLGADPLLGLQAVADVRAVIKDGRPVTSRVDGLRADDEYALDGPT